MYFLFLMNCCIFSTHALLIVDFEAVVLNKLAEMATQLKNLTTKIDNLCEKQNELSLYIMDKMIVPNQDSVIDYKKK